MAVDGACIAIWTLALWTMPATAQKARCPLYAAPFNVQALPSLRRSKAAANGTSVAIWTQNHVVRSQIHQCLCRPCRRRSAGDSVPEELRSAADGASIAIWTTTPWTMPANMAVAVNGSLQYSLVQTQVRELVSMSSCQQRRPANRVQPSACSLLISNFRTWLVKMESQPKAAGSTRRRRLVLVGRLGICSHPLLRCEVHACAASGENVPLSMRCTCQCSGL